MRPDIKVWNPENPAQWNKTLAWTTVWLSTFSLTFGFCAWFLVPSLAPRLNEIGFSLTQSALLAGGYGWSVCRYTAHSVDLLTADIRNPSTRDVFNRPLAYPALLLGVRRSARRYPLLGPSRFCFVKRHRRRNLFRLDGLY